MGVELTGVVVIHGDPVEPCAEVLFCLQHERARRRLEVGKIARVFGRDDEPELVTIAFAARQERFIVDPVLVGTIELTAFTFAVDAVALNVFEVRAVGGAPDALGGTCDMDLHYDPPHAEFRVGGLTEEARAACAAAAPDLHAGKWLAACGSRKASRGAVHFRLEALAARGAAIPDVAKVRGEFVLAAHDEVEPAGALLKARRTRNIRE